MSRHRATLADPRNCETQGERAVENLAPSRLLKTRQGTIAVGIAAAVLAAILLLVYLSNYRNSVKGSTEPVTVLVAKSLIPKGTTGTTIATKSLYVVTTIPKGQL